MMEAVKSISRICSLVMVVMSICAEAQQTAVSPQIEARIIQLDGGYTVFGQVTSGMEVVDHIVKGYLIRKIRIVEQ